tara:strand:+ start:1184 stop:1984 length:801 start_codon:yes stop_codon:yes gene_type:complete
MKTDGFNQQLYNFVWPKLSYLKLKFKLLKPASRACLKSIKQQLDSNTFETQQDRINFIRNWVNTNSVHLIDEEHDNYAFNVPEVLSRLNNHALDSGIKDGEKPHLSCGPRAYVMKAILDFMGIQSRIIDLFGLTALGEERLKVSPHTLIEVFEADTNTWVLHDPDFNVAYANRQSKAYQSAEQMLNLKPEDKGYETSGYKIENLLNLQNTVAGLFEWGILYRYSYDGKQSLLIHKNDKYFNMSLSNFENFNSFIVERAFNLKSVQF